MQTSSITRTVACLLVLLTHVPGANAQETASGSDTTSAPGLRRIGVHAGFGNVVGGLGVSGEYFVAGSRFSGVIGAGYLAGTNEVPGGAGVGVAIRGFTTGVRHRGFLELSVLPLQWSDVQVLYGPGLSVGYHYTAAGGFTIIGGAGVGWSVSTDEAAPIVLLAFGHTWR